MAYRSLPLDHEYGHIQPEELMAGVPELTLSVIYALSEIELGIDIWNVYSQVSGRQTSMKFSYLMPLYACIHQVADEFLQAEGFQ